MTPEDPQARRERLAQSAAIREHRYHADGVETLDNAGHADPFATCPHPDCVVVREVEVDRLEPIPIPALDRSWPIALNAAQDQAAKTWAADDRLWTTQETVEFNLRVFARAILSALSLPPAPAPPGVDLEAIKLQLEYWLSPSRLGERAAYEIQQLFSKLIAEVVRLQMQWETRDLAHAGTCEWCGEIDQDPLYRICEACRSRVNENAAEVERLAAVRTPAPEHCRVERFPLSEDFKQDIARNIDIGRGVGRTPAAQPDVWHYDTLKEKIFTADGAEVADFSGTADGRQDAWAHEIVEAHNAAVPPPAEARELEKP